MDGSLVDSSPTWGTSLLPNPLPLHLSDAGVTSRPQSDFRIPEGILNYHGTKYVLLFVVSDLEKYSSLGCCCSTIAVILWALGKDGAKIDGLSLVVGGEDVYSGGVGPIASDNPSYSPRS